MSESNTQAPAAPAQAANPSTETLVDQTTPTTELSAAPEAKAEEKKRLKQLNYKANGKDYSEDLPFEIDDNPEVVEYLTKQFSLAKAAQAAMQETSSTKKQVDQFVKALKGNTREVLADMGIDPKQFAAAVLEEEIKKSQMSPEQKELEELRSQKRQMEEERQRLKEQADQENRSKEEQIAYEQISNEIASAISTTYLPKEPALVKRVAEYMRVANAKGIKISAKEVMPFVEQDLKEEHKSILAQLGEDNIEDFVGKDVFKKVRKRNVEKSKATPTTAATAKAGTVEVKKEAKKESSNDKGKTAAKDFFGFKL